MAAANVVKTPISGGALTSNIASDRIRVYRLDEVFQLEPYKTPLLALMQRIGIESCPNNKFEWLERGRMQRSTTTVEEFEWNSGEDQEIRAISVTNRDIFLVNQVVYCVDTQGGAGSWVGRVVDLTGELGDYSGAYEAISVARVLPDDAPIELDAITTNQHSELLIIGWAGEEGSGLPPSSHVQPDTEYGYIQEFRNTWQISKQLAATDVYGQPEAQALATETMGIHRMDIEKAAWFGVRRKNDANGDNARWYSDGVLNRIATHNSLNDGVMADNLTYDNMVSEIQPLYELNPGQTLFGFCGPSILSRVSSLTWQGGDTLATKAPRTTISNDRPLMSEVFGMRIAEVHTPHGILKLIPHYEVFRRRATYTDPGPDYNVLALQLVVLDLDEIRGCTLAGHGIGVIEENVQPVGQHSRIDGITSDFGLMMKHEVKHGKYAFTT